jgi:hypothetical protein
MIDWLNDWMIECLIDWLIEYLIEYLIDWMIEWLNDWMLECLNDWLNDWMNGPDMKLINYAVFDEFNNLIVIEKEEERRGIGSNTRTHTRSKKWQKHGNIQQGNKSEQAIIHTKTKP